MPDHSSFHKHDNLSYLQPPIMTRPLILPQPLISPTPPSTNRRAVQFHRHRMLLPIYPTSPQKTGFSRKDAREVKGEKNCSERTEMEGQKFISTTHPSSISDSDC